MGMDTLLRTLAHEVDAEAERVIAEARREAAAVTEASLERQRVARDSRRQEREAELASRAAHARATARRDARSETLAARAALLDRVRAAARALLPTIMCRDGAAISARELERALAYAPPGAVTVHCPQGSVEAVRALVATRAETTVVADATVLAGVRVSSDDGAVVIDATLDARLERRWPLYAIAITRRLEATS